MSSDSLLVGVNSLQSDEDRLKHIELIKICTTLQKKVIDLEDELKRTKTAQQTKIDGLERRVKKLKKKKRSRTHKLKRLYKGWIDEIDADKDIALVSTHDDVSTQDNIVQDEGIGDVGKEEVVEVVTTAKMLIDIVVYATQVTTAIVDIPVRAAKTIVTTALTITAESTNKMLRLVRLLRGKKVEDDKESKELKKCLEIVLDDGDDVTIDATPLSSKSLTIVDYKIYKKGKKMYFQIFRADSNSQMNLTFSKLLKNFDREDLEIFWRLVKTRFEKTRPVDNIFLLHTLNTMFEHHVEDNLVEKMYPLKNHTLHQMIYDVKLQVDYECEMAYELLRLVKKQLKEGYRAN
nr:hypothetical protein [Tanacetum cinerariifolium]